ncbi:aminotransferase class I/II-fold pyridoxal phosphate-dependent enzyme [Streptomyces jumonjinensis]|uniref:Aminotransferase class I/II-fold pyridoxal phosphate-dependent enzyme n=1 Tax=Streptomyces jumonjinensis TaxID=1945 RepID=A0A646K9F9_STRJU|nr:aminotransferase class I/II-fold pyridoxal phosphate-dependent enzyme [Streptomyces jumonjinensis]MQS98727.1 aminotransferase class I/II-fold pyridoxal phosphate-dependent enzyme [Streptomyces jumonjinensis]
MAAHSLDDYARLAREGRDAVQAEFLAAEERASAGNREILERTGLRQGPAEPPGPPETATKILGRTWSAPLVVGPLAGLFRPEGELAVVRASRAAGLPVVVSAFSGRTFAELSAAAEGPLWLHTRLFRDRGAARWLVSRAQDAGFGAVVLTLGPQQHARLAPGAVPVNLAEDVPIRPPSGGPLADLGGYGPFADPSALLDHTVDWPGVEWLRSVCPLPLLIAGVRTPEDASRALRSGADGIVAETLDTLPAIAATVAGRCPVLLRGGIGRGADVLVSLASGADAVLLERPVLDGLLVAGREGVGAVLDEVVRELRAALVFTGTGSAADADPGLLRTGRTPAREPDTGPPAREAAHPPRTGDLRKSDLHTSVGDPVLDTMNFLNEVTQRYPDAISFAPGRPYDGFFDTEQIVTHIRAYLDHLTGQGLSPQAVRTAMYQYGPTAGQIREIIADSLRADENTDVPAESIVVTVGAQEAMLLVLRALITGPDDVFLVSSPCYVGITGAALLLDTEVRAVEERADGVSCADFEAAIERERAHGRRPRAFYVVPDHSNPSGTTMSMRARVELLDLAARHDLLIVEDSPYRLVSPGTPLPSLKSLDRDRRVIQLGSFSKTIFPGARVGFVVADQRVTGENGATSLLADELAKIKSMVTVNTSSLSQAAVAGALLSARGRLSELNARPAEYYGDAMRATLRELDRNLPAERRAELGVGWNEPTGGFFLTVHVPFPADNETLTRSAQEFGVLWTPMKYFYPQAGGDHAIRLSTSYLTPAEITEGTARLARFITALSTEPQT